MSLTSTSLPLMDLKRALWICKAINQRMFFAMGIGDGKVDPLRTVTLSEMLEARCRVELENMAALPGKDKMRTLHVIPADRLIAAVYALEHFDPNNEAVVVMLTRDILGTVSRKALGIVELPGTADAPQGDEVAA